MKKENQRREFIKTTALGTVTAIAGISLLSACNEKEGKEKEVSPPEDLMQEHGILNRILLIYDCCKIQLIDKGIIQTQLLLNSANIIRSFVEDYHEKQEEEYLFPRFEKANKLTDLVKVLRQ